MTALLDKEILDLVIGETTIRNMGSFSFLHWIAKKIDGQPSYKAATVELNMAVSSPPMSSSMPDEEKIRLVRKLEALEIPLP